MRFFLKEIYGWGVGSFQGEIRGRGSGQTILSTPLLPPPPCSPAAPIMRLLTALLQKHYMHMPNCSDSWPNLCHQENVVTCPFPMQMSCEVKADLRGNCGQRALLWSICLRRWRALARFNGSLFSLSLSAIRSKSEFWKSGSFFSVSPQNPHNPKHMSSCQQLPTPTPTPTFPENTSLPPFT